MPNAIRIIKNRDFTGINIRNVEANEWVFYRCKFDKADLTNTSFHKTQFIGCSFDRATWEKSNLEHARFSTDDLNCPEVEDNYSGFLNEFQSEVQTVEYGWGWPKSPPLLINSPLCSGVLSSFHRSNLFCAYFEGYRLNDCDFSESDLSNASFQNCSLDHGCFKNIRFICNAKVAKTADAQTLFGKGTSLEFVDFSGTNLRGLSFSNCASLEAANFTWADLDGAVFEGVPDLPTSLYRTCFDHARLTNVIFNHCELDSATFIGCDLRQVKFLGKTRAKAANFSSSYLAGCQGKNIDFTAAIFSGAFIGMDVEAGSVNATFSNATLMSADFTNAAVIGVDFDNCDLSYANFDSATFTIKGNDNGTNGTREVKKTFCNANMKQTEFRSVNLNGYHFIGCDAEGAEFEKSKLEKVKFISTNLDGCSFDESYLSGAEFYPDNIELPQKSTDILSQLILTGASFVNTKLENAKFYHSNLVGAIFTGSDVSTVNFHHCTMIGADFKNCDLNDSTFETCNLNSVNFEQVYIDGIKLVNAYLSAAQFVKAHGSNVFITTRPHPSGEIPSAVVFKLHRLEGTFKIEMQGAIVEHGNFSFAKESEVSWLPGLHCVGSIFYIKGKLSILGALVENTNFVIDDCENFYCEASTIQSSSINGLDSKCVIKNTNIDSCNLGIGWEKSYFEDSILNSTNLNWDNAKKEFTEIELDDIKYFDKKTIAALKVNADSLGDYPQSDNFFNLQMQKQIKEKNEKVQYLYFATFFILLFFIWPYLLKFIVENVFTTYGISTALFSSGAYFLYLSKTRFLGHLYGYGHKLKNMAISIILLILGFACSWICNDLKGKAEITKEIVITSLHYSINTIATIGYTDIVPRPEGIMLLYSNLESVTGIVAIALLVATIVRRTSGR